MLAKRAQDAREATRFRSERITLINGLFYFSTRENTLEGPYPSHAQALTGAQLYIERMQLAEDIRAYRL